MKRALRLVRQLMSEVRPSDNQYTVGYLDALAAVEELLLDEMWRIGEDDDDDEDDEE